MRFDDTLETVLAHDTATPAARQAAWRQIVDLVGRNRVSSVDRAVAALAAIRDAIPRDVRSASARALYGAQPPLALVRLLAGDDVAVGAPILRSATLPADDWIALLPTLTPTARAILRHRRDLPAAATRALESYGPVDFVIADENAATLAVPGPALAPAPPAEADPFVAVGRVAMSLPLVAEALRRENDNEQPPATEGTFRIADIVARIEAYQRHDPAAPRPARDTVPRDRDRDGFRFETDADGAVRWVDGGARGALIGVSLARPARPGEAGVDGIAAGAWRRRAAFRDARLLVDGADLAAGLWLLSATPIFDPATGRFGGYRGSARRPRAADGAPPVAADAMRQLVHELRTPTTALSGFAEMIEHQMLGPVAASYRAQAAAIHADSRALLAAIDDVDTAARIDGGALPLRGEAVALGSMLAAIASDLAPLARERGASLAIGGDDDRRVVADPAALERLLTRWLAATLGAARPGERVAGHILPASAGRVALTIDRVAAFAAHPGEAILDADAEASPATLLGTGFALRLARNLARAMGGTLVAGAQCLTLYLPAAVEEGMGRARHR